MKRVFAALALVGCTTVSDPTAPVPVHVDGSFTPSEQYEIGAAMSLWSTASDGHIRFVPTPLAAEWNVHRLRPSDPLVQARDTVATETAGSLRFVLGWVEGRRIYLVPDRVPTPLYRLVLHELGHAAQLRWKDGNTHNPNTPSAMSELYSDSDLTVSDIEMCRFSRRCP